MRKLYLHVGYPKTGTTTLQKAVFRKLHEAGAIGYLGMFGLWDDKDPMRKEFFKSLTDAMYIESEEEFEDCLHSLKGTFKSVSESFDGAIPLVLSNEHFTLSQTSTKVRGARIDVFRTARRLGQIFDTISVDILLCVRRQDKLAWSLFLENMSRRQHAHAAEYKDADQFLTELAAGKRPGHDAYNFHDVIQGYNQAFPSARKFIWTFEMFKQAPANTVFEILEFLEIPEGLFSEDAFDLKPQNVKSSQQTPISFIRSNRAIDLASRTLRAAGLQDSARRSLKSFFSILLPKDQPKAPTDCVMRQFLDNFKEANESLSLQHPNLAPQLAEYGYLGTPGTKGGQE